MKSFVALVKLRGEIVCSCRKEVLEMALAACTLNLNLPDLDKH